MVEARRFPPPWSVEEHVSDANGQAAFNIFASLRAASIRAPGEAKLVISHNLRRFNAVSR
jgi:hypothetical protein